MHPGTVAFEDNGGASRALNGRLAKTPGSTSQPLGRPRESVRGRTAGHPVTEGGGGVRLTEGSTLIVALSRAWRCRRRLPVPLGVLPVLLGGPAVGPLGVSAVASLVTVSVVTLARTWKVALNVWR